MSELTVRECNGRGHLFMECAETAYMHEPAEDDGENEPRASEYVRAHLLREAEKWFRVARHKGSEAARSASEDTHPRSGEPHQTQERDDE